MTTHDKHGEPVAERENLSTAPNDPTLKYLEAGAVRFLDNAVAAGRDFGDTAFIRIQLSQAISLKRIADSLAILADESISKLVGESDL
jgi:hypothetical protein